LLVFVKFAHSRLILIYTITFSLQLSRYQFKLSGATLCSTGLSILPGFTTGS
jgi:hypothetical protein